MSCSRHSSAPATSKTQPASMASSHGSLLSVPVPSPCQSATGQDAYASRCTARQARYDSRPRSRLVITSARIRSNAIAPSPSQNVR